MNSRDRIRDLITDALTRRQVEVLLNSALDEVIELVEADPELRHEIIRDALRGSIFSTFWRI